METVIGVLVVVSVGEGTEGSVSRMWSSVFVGLFVRGSWTSWKTMRKEFNSFFLLLACDNAASRVTYI